MLTKVMEFIIAKKRMLALTKVLMYTSINMLRVNPKPYANDMECVLLMLINGKL